jgi:hypothetical protein
MRNLNAGAVQQQTLIHEQACPSTKGMKACTNCVSEADVNPKECPNPTTASIPAALLKMLVAVRRGA